MVIFAWMPDTVNFKLSSGRYSVVLEISLAWFQDALTPHVGNRFSWVLLLRLVRLDQGASQVVLVVKNPPANAGDTRDACQFLGWEDPLEKGISSILAWRIPWTEEGAWWATVHSVAKSWT